MGALLALVAAVFAPGTADAWGGRTHEIINRRAVDYMPEDARAAWAPLARSLGAHASDADHRKGTVAGERPRHFIDIDVYDEHPFDDVPRSLDELIAQQGRETVDQWGIVPWAVDECYRMLVLSLQQDNWASAGAWAADLGHYVADSHQPLHCTVNYDGQNTGNKGVHLRFEVHMMDRHFDEAAIGPIDSLPAAPGDPIPFCFDWIAEAYPELSVILGADDQARGTDSNYGDDYYRVLWGETEDVATRQVTRAVRDLAVLYAAAWEGAGRPAGPVDPPPFHALDPAKLTGEEQEKGGSSRKVWIVAGAVLLGAFLLGG